MPAFKLRGLFSDWQQGRGFTAATVKRRNTAVKSFATWCAPMEITEAVFTDVEEWLAGFSSPRTRHAYRSDLNCFYRWAVKRKLCASNPVDDVDSVRVPKGLPKPVAAEQIPLILATADCANLRMACALAAYAGLRRAEIVHLDVADVSLHASSLVVRHGKGGKDRSVLVIAPLAAILTAHMPRFGLIVPWTESQCGDRIARHLRGLGIDATAHSLRHSAATEAARHADLRTVADFLGHSSVVTTEGYAALTRNWTSLAGMFGPSMN